MKLFNDIKSYISNNKYIRVSQRVTNYLWGESWEEHSVFLGNLILEIGSLAVNGGSIYLCEYITKTYDKKDNEEIHPLDSKEMAILAGYAGAFLLNQIIFQTKKYYFRKEVVNAVKSLFNDTVEKAYALGYAHNHADFSYHLNKLHEPVVNYLNGTLSMSFEILRVLTIPSLVWYIYEDYTFGATMLGSLLLSIIPTVLLFKYQFPASERVSAQYKGNFDMAIDGMERYTDLQLYNRIEDHINNIKTGSDRLVSSYTQAARREFIINILRQSIVAACYLGMNYFSLKKLRSAQMNHAEDFGIEDLILINLYTMQFIIPFSGLTESIAYLREGNNELDTILEFLSKPIKRLLEGNKELNKNGLYEITFNNVIFDKILKNITFKIKPGEKVALVGPSGSGKSTIANLLMRFLEPTKGDIFIGDERIDNYKLESLRNYIGYAPQSPNISPGTVYDNIIYAAGRPVSKAEIKQLLTKVGLNESFLDREAKSLSGGEKQRLAVAKLIIRDPAIIIIDEVTAALDSVKENALLTNIFNIFGHNKTIIFVTHQLRTISDFDKIIVLNKQGERVGEIIEQGNFIKLYHNIQGIFREYYDAQNTEMVFREKIKVDAEILKFMGKYAPNTMYGLGMAYDDEDSFFEAVSQCLVQYSSDRINTSLLRKKCALYANNPDDWLQQELSKVNQNLQNYAKTIICSVTISAKFSKFGYETSIISGCAHIEGRILCNMLDIRIYLIKSDSQLLLITDEGVEKVDKIDNSNHTSKVVIIYECGKDRYAPIFEIPSLNNYIKLYEAEQRNSNIQDSNETARHSSTMNADSSTSEDANAQAKGKTKIPEEDNTSRNKESIAKIINSIHNASPTNSNNNNQSSILSRSTKKDLLQIHRLLQHGHPLPRDDERFQRIEFKKCRIAKQFVKELLKIDLGNRMMPDQVKKVIPIENPNNDKKFKCFLVELTSSEWAFIKPHKLNKKQNAVCQQSDDDHNDKYNRPLSINGNNSRIALNNNNYSSQNNNFFSKSSQSSHVVPNTLPVQNRQGDGLIAISINDTSEKIESNGNNNIKSMSPPKKASSSNFFQAIPLEKDEIVDLPSGTDTEYLLEDEQHQPETKKRCIIM